MSRWSIVCGDSPEVLKRLSDNSVHAVVTDPPYGLKFMGAKWDYEVPSVALWQEVLRVLKPGGHLLAFAGTRTQHRMAVNIEDAGFEIRDLIAWIYGASMPKSHNLKGSWDGYGSALKPTIEPITMARKPLGEATIADNVLKHGTGAINIDGCRIAVAEGIKGRFPANVIMDEEAGKLLDEQSGPKSASFARNRTDGARPFNNNGKDTGYTSEKIEVEETPGGASRFFYCAKANKHDREEGNSHPTVKPTELMRYLCRLITPPDGIILDPFMGSGSTGKAALLEGFRFVGIDLLQEHVDIAKRRLVNAETP